MLFSLFAMVDGSISACEESDDYARKVISMRNHGIIMKRVMIILDRNKSKNNIVDARQAIHPCISYAPMFINLHCFPKFYYLCATC